MSSELVRRASVTGLAVRCRFLAGCDRLAPAASQAAYRVVQEALTNALKHAPGAPVDITIRDRGREVRVDIENAPPRQVQAAPGPVRGRLRPSRDARASRRLRGA
jgi:signal transduction histidine kinase